MLEFHVPRSQVPRPRVPVPESQGLKSQGHRVPGPRVSGLRVPGSSVSGLRFPGPGSQALILDYAAKNRPYYVCHDFIILLFFSFYFDYTKVKYTK